MNPKSLLLAIALAFALVGCATKVATPSGRPEVTISGHTLDEVRGAITDEALAKGLAPVKTEGRDLVFDHEAPAAMSILLSNGNPARTQLRFSMVPAANGDVRVILVPVVVYQSGGATHTDDLTGRNLTASQDFLGRVQARLH